MIGFVQLTLPLGSHVTNPEKMVKKGMMKEEMRKE